MEISSGHARSAQAIAAGKMAGTVARHFSAADDQITIGANFPLEPAPASLQAKLFMPTRFAVWFATPNRCL
jgi:hypothetical protein